MFNFVISPGCLCRSIICFHFGLRQSYCRRACLKARLHAFTQRWTWQPSRLPSSSPQFICTSALPSFVAIPRDTGHWRSFIQWIRNTCMSARYFWTELELVFLSRPLSWHKQDDEPRESNPSTDAAFWCFQSHLITSVVGDWWSCLNTTADSQH